MLRKPVCVESPVDCCDDGLAEGSRAVLAEFARVRVMADWHRAVWSCCAIRSPAHRQLTRASQVKVTSTHAQNDDSEWKLHQPESIYHSFWVAEMTRMF